LSTDPSFYSDRPFDQQRASNFPAEVERRIARSPFNEDAERILMAGETASGGIR
jgi:hypothetical protein